MTTTMNDGWEMGSMVRRVATTALLAAPLIFVQHAQAQGASAGVESAYPTKPVRIIVPQSAGGSTDLVARAVAQKLTEALKETFLVDNRPGAGSISGTDAVAKAPPDGYTLLAVAASFAINPSLNRNLPFDPVRDFAPLTQLATLPHLLVVHPSMPVKTVKALIAMAKSQPGEINYASSGVATSTHLAAELFMHLTSTRMINVPYKGGAPSLVATMSGECQVNFSAIATSLPQVRAGKLRGIAVTSTKRSVAAPEFPTIAESGVPSYEHNSWVGLLAPAATPAAIVARLNDTSVKIVQAPELKAQLLRGGLEAAGNSPAAFGQIIASEVAKWKALTKAAGIKGR